MDQDLNNRQISILTLRMDGASIRDKEICGMPSKTLPVLIRLQPLSFKVHIGILLPGSSRCVPDPRGARTVALSFFFRLRIIITRAIAWRGEEPNGNAISSGGKLLMAI